MSEPYVDSATRLAAIFPPERSTKVKALMLAVQTVTASFKCISLDELKFISTTQCDVLQSRDKYQALVHDHQRISQEIEVSVFVSLRVNLFWQMVGVTDYLYDMLSGCLVCG